MTKLSFWAKHHPSKARIIIVVLHLVLNMLAVYSGITLLQLGMVIPASLVYVTIVLFFTAVFLYPSKQQINIRLNKRQLYTFRKSCDFVLGGCSFILVCFAANNYLNTHLAPVLFAAEAVSYIKPGEKPGAGKILASLAHRDKKH